MTTWNVVGTTKHVALGELQQDGGVDGHMDTGEMDYTDNSQNSTDQSVALEHWVKMFETLLMQNNSDVEATIQMLDDQGCPDAPAVAEMWILQQENPDPTEDLSEIPPAEDPSMTPAPQDVAQAPQQPLASTKKTAYTAQDVRNWIQQGASEEAIRYELSLGGQEALYDEAVGAAPAPQAPQGGGSLRERIMGQPTTYAKTADVALDEYGAGIDGAGAPGDPGMAFDAVQEDPIQVAKEWLHECFDDTGEEGVAEYIEQMGPDETKQKVEQFYGTHSWADFLSDMGLAPEEDPDEELDIAGNAVVGEPLDEQRRRMIEGKTADLAGEGPKRDKANEIYKAIRRDHPDKDKSSAAAIANDSANKLFEKKDDKDSDDDKGSDKGKSDSDDDGDKDDKDDDGKPPWLNKKDSRASYQGLNGRIAAIFTDTWGDKMVLLSTEHGDLTVPASEVEAPVGDEAPADDPVGEINEFLQIIDPAGHIPASYHARINNLSQVVAAGRKTISEGIVSLADQMALDEIVIKANAEILELTKLAEEYVSDEDLNYVDTLPQWGMGAGGVVEQADVGHQSDGGWLDETYHDMVSDAEGTDFDAIVNEEPALLVSDMPDAVLADQGAATAIATNYISARTHFVPEDVRLEIHTAFIAKTEQARRNALAQRKIAMKRTAAELPDADGPAEGLFV